LLRVSAYEILNFKGVKPLKKAARKTGVTIEIETINHIKATILRRKNSFSFTAFFKM